MIRVRYQLIEQNSDDLKRVTLADHPNSMGCGDGEAMIPSQPRTDILCSRTHENSKARPLTIVHRNKGQNGRPLGESTEPGYVLGLKCVLLCATPTPFVQFVVLTPRSRPQPTYRKEGRHGAISFTSAKPQTRDQTKNNQKRSCFKKAPSAEALVSLVISQQESTVAPIQVKWAC